MEWDLDKVLSSIALLISLLALHKSSHQWKKGLIKKETESIYDFYNNSFKSHILLTMEASDLDNHFKILKEEFYSIVHVDPSLDKYSMLDSSIIENISETKKIIIELFDELEDSLQIIKAHLNLINKLAHKILDNTDGKWLDKNKHRTISTVTNVAKTLELLISNNMELKNHTQDILESYISITNLCHEIVNTPE